MSGGDDDVHRNIHVEIVLLLHTDVGIEPGLVPLGAGLLVAVDRIRMSDVLETEEVSEVDFREAS